MQFLKCVIAYLIMGVIFLAILPAVLLFAVLAVIVIAVVWAFDQVRGR